MMDWKTYRSRCEKLDYNMGYPRSTVRGDGFWRSVDKADYQRYLKAEDRAWREWVAYERERARQELRKQIIALELVLGWGGTSYASTLTNFQHDAMRDFSRDAQKAKAIYAEIGSTL